VIGTAKKIIGGFTGKTQADAATDAADQSTATTWKMYEQNRADIAPWREAGSNAVKTLLDKINAGPGSYTESPGYQFRLGEGLKSIDRTAAAKGGALSGSAIKAAQRYAQDYATNDYDNYLSRYYQSLTPYQSLAGLGQTSAGQTASLGANAAQNVNAATTAGLYDAASANAKGSENILNLAMLAASAMSL